MKKVICILLCAAMLMLCACSGNTEAAFNVGSDALMEEKTSLKVFAIGNSFSNDVTSYLYEIAEAEGVTDIVIGRLYFGGCSLERHARNASEGTAEYTYYKNTTGEWVQTDNATLLQGLQDEDWDIITLQQASHYSGVADTYNEDLDALVRFVNENKTNPDAKLVWHMTWAYQSTSDHSGFATYGNDQLTMYNGICQAVRQKVESRGDFAAILPVGTAIQNARTSYFGDSLTRDGFHLNDLGKLIGGYTWYAVFTGKPLETVNLAGISDWFQLSDSNKDIIKEAVNNALTTPYAVTQSAFTE